MATCNVVCLKDINIKDRIDAEYFQPEFLQVVNKLGRNNPPLESIAKPIASAFYPAATQLYSVGDVPFVRCVDVIDYPVISSLQNNEFEKLPNSFIQDNKTIKKLKAGEIVITKVGTPCYASVIDKSLSEVAISRTVLGLTNIKIDPNYLVAFLRSKYGFLQLKRECELTIQIQLTLRRVGRIRVFIPLNEEKIREISSIVKEYFRLFKISNDLYEEAKRLLLNGLSFGGFTPKYRQWYLSSFSEVRSSHRLDAEYFQPAYEELLESLKTKYDLKPLKHFVRNAQKGIEVGSRSYQEEGRWFIRVSNISEHGFVKKDSRYISEDLYHSLKDKFGLNIGDFLLTKDATPGVAYSVKEHVDGIISSGILKFAIDESEIEREYLALCINSLIGRLQVERDSGGSIITHWRPTQIKELKIPILPRDIQKKIGSLIQNAHSTRKKANNLFNEATREVETLIENKT